MTQSKNGVTQTVNDLPHPPTAFAPSYQVRDNPTNWEEQKYQKGVDIQDGVGQNLIKDVGKQLQYYARHAVIRCVTTTPHARLTMSSK